MERFNNWPKEAEIKVADVAVVILCGGFATRLGRRPKHLLEVDTNLLVLDLSLAPLLAQGAKKIIFATGAHHDETKAYAEKLRSFSGLHVETLFSPPTGALSAVVSVAQKVDLGCTFLLWNGDEIIPGIQLLDLYRYHLCFGKLITRVVCRKASVGTRKVAIKENWCVSFQETGDIFFATGAMVVNKEILDLAAKAVDSDSFWTSLLESEEVAGYVHNRSVNINSPDDLERVTRAYKLLKSQVQSCFVSGK